MWDNILGTSEVYIASLSCLSSLFIAIAGYFLLSIIFQDN
jgi:hypothetical protein